MKRFISALVAILCLALLASTAMAADMHRADDKATLGQVEDILNRQMSAVDARLKSLKTQLDWKANANQSASKEELNAVRQALDDQRDVDRLIKGRLNKLKMAVKADRADIEALIAEVKKLRTVSGDTLKALNGLDIRLMKVEGDQKAQTDRVVVIENRQDKTDDVIKFIDKRVVDLESAAWNSELRLGAETGRSIATSSTDFVAGYAATSKRGVGWYTDMVIGAGDLFGKPHFTSAVIRAGVKSVIGSPDSPLSAHLGFLMGVAAKSSLALDAGFAGGASAGLIYKPKTWPIGFTASVGNVWGRFEGLIMSAGVYFDPLGLSTLGK